MHERDAETIPDDETSSGGSDTVEPEVLESENDEMIVENVIPRGVKYNFVLTPPLTTLKNTDTSENNILQSHCLANCPQGRVF